MVIYQTTVGEPISLELYDAPSVPIDLSLYDEDKSFLRLSYSTVFDTTTIDVKVRFGTGNKLYYDVVEGVFLKAETVLAQVFLIKEEVSEEKTVLTRRKPLGIFEIEVLEILKAPA